MDKDFFRGIKFGTGASVVFLIVFSVVYAVGFHQTSEIVPGVFQGDYTFNGSVNFSKGVDLGNNSITCNTKQGGNLEFLKGNIVFCNGSEKRILKDEKISNASTVYSSKAGSGDQSGSCFYDFTNNFYLENGTYKYHFEAYDNDGFGEVSVRLSGPVTIDIYASSALNGAWIGSSGTVEIPVNGTYDIQGVQHRDCGYRWGVRGFSLIPTHMVKR